MPEQVYVIPGPPRTKKTHGTIVGVHTGRRAMMLPSKQYKKWFKVAMTYAPVIRVQMMRDGGYPFLPLSGPVEVSAKFYRDIASGDLCGYLQSLGDYLQQSTQKVNKNGKVIKRDGAGVIKDDRQIVSWDGSRLLKDAANPRIEFCIRALPGEQFSLLPEEDEDEL